MNWGLPDWRNPDAYPDSLSENQWRWEFLRRRKDYREDWLLHFESSYRKNLQHYENMPLPEGVDSWNNHFSGCVNMPKSKEKYGVNFLLDPSLPNPAPGLFTHKNGFVVGYASDSQFEQYSHDGVHLVAIDINRPLTEQFKKAKELLSRIQNEVKGKVSTEKKFKDKWSFYLRFLDADTMRSMESGLTWDKIGEALFTKSYENKAARACEYFDQARGVQDKLISV